jgi:hypothetical protein
VEAAMIRSRLLFRKWLQVLLAIGLVATFGEIQQAMGFSLTSPLRSPHAVLRSAWMLDAGSVMPPRPATPGEEVAQIQRHFSAVEKILIRNSSSSISVAISRLQRSSGRLWTAEETQSTIAALRERRRHQLATLRAYRQAGRFPLNDNPRAPTRPIFVDRHDTACAVGHLMRKSGRADQVAEIAQSNNFIVVRQVRYGPLIDWILTSGLTQEEAALIQPGYEPPSAYAATLAEMLRPGAFLRGSGVRFENFAFTVNQSASIPVDPNQIHLIMNLSDIMTARYPFVPTGTHFLALHGQLAQTQQHETLRWTLDFDVVGEVPSIEIEQFVLTSDQFHMLSGGDIKFNSSVTSMQGLLGEVQIEPSFRGDSENIIFSPQRRLHVQTTLTLTDAGFSRDIAHEFGVIPEPGTFTICLIAGVVLIGGFMSRLRGRGIAKAALSR